MKSANYLVDTCSKTHYFVKFTSANRRYLNDKTAHTLAVRNNGKWDIILTKK